MFAGIGGFRSGLSHYGDFFVPVGYCEIDPYAKRAYDPSPAETRRYIANLRAMCYTFISFALWLETQSHGVHSVFVFRYVEFSFLLRCEMQNRR